MAKKKLKTRKEIMPDKITLPSPLTDDTLLTREEAALYARCSLRTIVDWIENWGLREAKKGKYSRIRKKELDKFLESQPAPVKPMGISNPTDEESLKAWERMSESERAKRKFLGQDYEDGLKGYFRKIKNGASGK